MTENPVTAAAFMKWQLPSEYDAPASKAHQQQLGEDFARRFGPEAAKQRESEEKQTKRAPEQKLQPATPEQTGVRGAKSTALKKALDHRELPKCPESKAGEATSGNNVRNRLVAQAQLLMADATPAEQSVIQRALRLTVEHTAGGQATGRKASLGGKIGKIASHQPLAAENQAVNNGGADNSFGECQLKHVRLLTPTVRANRWQHTTWHGMQRPAVEPSGSSNIGGGIISHSRVRRSQLAVPIEDQHYRIHPEWGYDAPLPGR